jgi:hypothetical protein
MSFFLNILILNTEEVIQQQVSNKFEGFPRFAQVIREYAQARVSEDLLADQLTHKICSSIIEAIKQLGIDASVRRRFLLGSFIVLHVKLIDIKIDNNRGAQVGAWLNRLGFKEMVENSFIRNAEHKLIRTLPAELKTQLGCIGIKVQVISKTEDQQSIFFFDVLNDESNEMELEFSSPLRPELD